MAAVAIFDIGWGPQPTGSQAWAEGICMSDLNCICQSVLQLSTGNHWKVQLRWCPSRPYGFWIGPKTIKLPHVLRKVCIKFGVDPWSRSQVIFLKPKMYVCSCGWFFYPPEKPESLLGIDNKDMFQVDRMRRSQVIIWKPKCDGQTDRCTDIRRAFLQSPFLFRKGNK